MYRPLYSEYRFTPAEHANFLAGKVVSYATAFLDGRHDAGALAHHARAVTIELLAVSDDAAARRILDPARLLAVAMMGCAETQDAARQDRWMHVMGAVVELVRHESRQVDRPDGDGHAQKPAGEMADQRSGRR